MASPRQHDGLSTSPAPSVTIPLQASHALSDPLFSGTDLSQISPSTASVSAEDLLPDTFFSTDDSFVDDWTYYDPLNPVNSDTMTFPASKRFLQDSFEPFDLSILDSLPLDTNALAGESNGEPVIVGSVEQSFNNATKRSRTPNDARSACWTSPLCPNHSKDGVPPNSATCGGGCAPYLFDYPENIDDDLSGLPALSIECPTSSLRPTTALSSTHDADSTDAHPPTPAPQEARSKISSSDLSPTQLKREPSQSTPEPDSPDAQPAKSRPRSQRVPHNQVERKYRETLNTQLESLRRVVPELCQQQKTEVSEGVDIEDLPAASLLPPSKPSKAMILASATTYIKHMEKEKKQMLEENRQLRARLKALQALVKCDECGLLQYVMDMKINGGKMKDG